MLIEFVRIVDEMLNIVDREEIVFVEVNENLVEEIEYFVE